MRSFAFGSIFAASIIGIIVITPSYIHAAADDPTTVRTEAEAARPFPAIRTIVVNSRPIAVSLSSPVPVAVTVSAAQQRAIAVNLPITVPQGQAWLIKSAFGNTQGDPRLLTCGFTVAPSGENPVVYAAGTADVVASAGAQITTALPAISCRISALVYSN